MKMLTAEKYLVGTTACLSLTFDYFSKINNFKLLSTNAILRSSIFIGPILIIESIKLIDRVRLKKNIV